MSRARRAVVAGVLSVAIGLFDEANARAEPESPPEIEASALEEAPSLRRGAGALTGFVLLRNTKNPDLGGAALCDLWFTDGALRIGAALGLGFVSGAADEDRLFTPVGASLAVGSSPRPVGFALRLRGGGWTGATNGGFAGGGWLAAGFYIEYALDPRLAIAAGMDAWFLFGHGDTTIFAPGISLVWSAGARPEGPRQRGPDDE
jgi:hypothetical protein